MSAQAGSRRPQHQVGVTAGADQRVCAQETVGGEVLAGGLELALVGLPLCRGQAPPGRVDLQERELDDIAVHGPDTNIRSPDRRSWCSRAPARRACAAPRRARAPRSSSGRARSRSRSRPRSSGSRRRRGSTAFGFMSAIQGSYTPEQTFLDMSAGARTTTSLYDDEVPTDLRLGRNGRMSSWRAITDRAQTAPADVVPGSARVDRAGGGRPRRLRRGRARPVTARPPSPPTAPGGSSGSRSTGRRGRRAPRARCGGARTCSSPSWRPGRRAGGSCAGCSARGAPATSCS